MRIKRTYNLSPETVATVKRLAEVEHVAATQDAVVEHAVAELSRQLRDIEDARQWSKAAGDDAFQDELSQIDADLPAADLARWE
jgi:hypothetical protein